MTYSQFVIEVDKLRKKCTATLARMGELDKKHDKDK